MCVELDGLRRLSVLMRSGFGCSETETGARERIGPDRGHEAHARDAGE